MKERKKGTIKDGMEKKDYVDRKKERTKKQKKQRNN